jgi:cell division protein FtsL
MTPPALTPAARGTTKRPGTDGPSGPSTGRSAGHRTGLRRGTAPRAPRRVSGPTAGAATVARPAVPPRTAPARPKAPRPAPRRSRTRSHAAAKAPWRLRSAAYVRALPDHALLDRIIRGRAWIPLLGVLLVGIVAMQVEVLKLNAGVGRSLERASALQSQNELLRAGVARLSDEQRIERIAAGMGMVMPSADQMRFVRSGPASVESALDSIKAPDSTNFLAQLPAIGAAAAAQGASTSTGTGTPVTATTGTTGASVTSAASASSTSVATSPAQGAASETPATTSGSTSGTSATPPVSPPAPSTTVGTTGTTGTTGTAGQISSSPSGGATPVGG